MIKKLMMSFVVFSCMTNVQAAKLDVVDDVTRPMTVCWECFKEARNVIKNKYHNEEDFNYIIAAFSDDIMYVGKMSIRGLSQKCMFYVKDIVECQKFMEAYVDYSGGDATDCTLATNAAPKFNNVLAKDDTLKAKIVLCQRYEDITVYKADGTENDKQKIYTGESIFGQCKEYLKHVKKCNRHLLKVYAEQANDSRRKDRQKYECVVKLLESGEMDLPATKMEERCEVK